MNKIIPIRLSHSSLETLHTCERKWQLEKLLVDPAVREENEHTVFGRAYGTGIATYLVTQDQEQALYQAWLAYWPELESDKKSIVMCMAALMAAFTKLDTLLMEYEVAEFNGKPAVELSFRLDINSNYYFVGHIDVVLRHRFTGVYSVWDAKSTGLQLLDLSPLYQNSGQVLGYSVALDRIVGEALSSYGVGFIVAQINAGKMTTKTHLLPFEKTLLDRLKWFMTLGLDAKKLKEMEELGHYPMRGHSCLTFMRPCRYFGTCNLASLDIPKVREEDLIQYDFHYNLDDLISDHLERVTNMPQQEATITDLEGLVL
jgi:hypothetical protein